MALQCDGSWDPTTLTQSSGRKVGWVCTKDKNHIWQATVSDRKKGHTCPVCLGRKIMYGYNDLATTHPDFAKESDGSWEPAKVIATANKTVNWVCRFNNHHKWRTTIRKRVTGLGCPVCTGRILVPGVNDLATLKPDIAAQCDGTWDPTTVKPTSLDTVGWVCGKNPEHKWRSPICSRKNVNSCLICLNRKVLPGYNDLATLNPVLASQGDGSWDPTKLTVSSHTKVTWVCTTNKKHKWKSSPNNRRNGSGCRICAKNSYNVEMDGWLYLIKHEEKNLLKIGISNKPKTRLAEHSRKGWELIDLKGPYTGELAIKWEKSILKALRGSGAPAPNHACKFDGHTESWTPTNIDVNTIRELQLLVEEFENKIDSYHIIY